jgi:Domain of unknown function (DUF5060)/Protein of unknown function (DUF4038)/Putative collagen-binding domain of a collagenase
MIAVLLLAAQTCAPAPSTYTPCEIAYELNDAEAAAHPNPYVSVRLHVEFRSPRYRTFLMPAFWDGGRRMVVRFSPTDAGEWTFRVSSNIQRFEGQLGKFAVTDSGSPGFVKTANVHHFSYTEDFKPHFWMGEWVERFAVMDLGQFRQLVDSRAAAGVNHLSGVVIGGPEDAAKVVPAPERIDPAFFRALDERILYMNGKGVVADLVLGAGANHLAQLFPTWQDRERYVRYLVARYSAMNITWQGVENFEEYENGRELLKEIGALLKKADPYQHPRSTVAAKTSVPLLGDGWMDYVLYRSGDDQLGSIEHQLYSVPFVSQAVGGGDVSEFRQRLWNTVMNGQYPASAGRNTDAASLQQMKILSDFFLQTRHWDLEPFFDVDGGRAVALESIEYIIYAQKPGQVEALIEKHKYDIRWFNPATGEWIKQKEFKGERFTGTPPDQSHDWVLHISREDKKKGMLRSYKFESRPILMQEIELLPAKIPFEIQEPAADPLPFGKPVAYASKIKRETRATRSMMWLWTGEVSAQGQGFRVLGTGPNGTFTIPPGIVRTFPAVLALRLYGMNANGKVYAIDRTYRVNK